MNGVIKVRYEEIYRKNMLRTTFRLFHMEDPVSIPEQFLENLIPVSRLPVEEMKADGLPMPPPGGGVVWISDYWWWDNIVSLRRNVSKYFQAHPEEKPAVELKAEDEWHWYPDPLDRRQK